MAKGQVRAVPKGDMPAQQVFVQQIFGLRFERAGSRRATRPLPPIQQIRSKASEPEKFLVKSGPPRRERAPGQHYPVPRHCPGADQDNQSAAYNRRMV
jgi:hypothetical protein